jgi:hypothetical protein
MMIAPSARYVTREHRIQTAKARPYIVTLGPDGNFWFSESGADRIGRLSTRDYTIAEFPLPHRDSRQLHRAADCFFLSPAPKRQRNSPFRTQWGSVIRHPLGGRAWLAQAGASATRILIGNTLSS